MFFSNLYKIKTDCTHLMEKPAPRKGITHFYQYIGKNFELPNNETISGKIYTQFVVDKNEKIVDANTDYAFNIVQ